MIKALLLGILLATSCVSPRSFDVPTFEAKKIDTNRFRSKSLFVAIDPRLVQDNYDAYLNQQSFPLQFSNLHGVLRNAFLLALASESNLLKVESTKTASDGFDFYLFPVLSISNPGRTCVVQLEMIIKDERGKTVSTESDQAKQSYFRSGGEACANALETIFTPLLNRSLNNIDL